MQSAVPDDQIAARSAEPRSLRDAPHLY